MNILITGGTGFIGSHLLHRLVYLKHNVSVIKSPNSDISRIQNILSNINTFDVVDDSDLESVFAKNGFDAVIHLATRYIKHAKEIKDIRSMNQSNITFPSILLELVAKHNVKSFINTGTCFEYKLSDKKISEEQDINPYNYYAATKLAFENILKYYVKEKNIDVLTLRLFYPYGEKDNKKIIPLVIDSLIKDQALEITYGEQKLNFTYVDDIVDAYISALSFITSKTYSGYELINIGTENVYSIKEVVDILSRIAGKQSNIKLIKPYPENEIMYMACNYAKAKRLLNWTPKTSIIEGLKKTYLFNLQNTL